jgi:hypothetical protein
VPAATPTAEAREREGPDQQDLGGGVRRGVEGRKRPDGIKDWLEENGAGRKQKRVRDADGEEKRRWFWVGIGLDDGNHESEQTNAL